MVKVIELTGTALGVLGAGTATLTSTQKVTGFIEKVDYDYNDGLTGADIVLTSTGVVAEAILTKANLGVVDTTFYPRSLANKSTDGSAFTNVAEKMFIHQSSFSAVVAEAGTTKTSKTYRFLVYVSDE